MIAHSNEPSRVRVVVVDDTPDLRDLLCLALSRSGDFTVVAEAGNGREAITVVERERPDLVLLDLAMPVMDGLEALPLIRGLCPEGTIVVLSGFGATAMAQRALATGADSYLQKGTPLSVILEHIRELTGRKTPARALRIAPDQRGPATAPDPAPPQPVGDEAGRDDARRDDAVPPAPYRPPVLASVPDPVRAPAASVVPVQRGDRADPHEALDLAPFGVIEVRDEPDFAITYANPAAARFVDADLRPGDLLATAAPRLAGPVGYHRLTDDISFDLTLGRSNRAVTCLLRRSGDALCLYLRWQESDDTADLLRRAIATAAHEIRNPVTVLTGIAETMELQGDVLTPEQRARLLASVARQARLLDSLTADLLTAAQVQRGTLRVDLERVDAHAIVEAVVGDGYGATVEVGGPTAVHADPFRLEQMVSNLLSNALKYGAAPVHVRVRPSGPNVLVEVSDHGPGVPADFEPHLFQEFARASGTQARGTGLGLFVVRSLAEAQGGSVSYAPRPGGGSVFTLALPSAG